MGFYRPYLKRKWPVKMEMAAPRWVLVIWYLCLAAIALPLLAALIVILAASGLTS